MREHSNDKRLWLGVILVIVGGVLLLNNLDIIPYYIPHYIFSWKTLLIALGLYFILARQKPEAGIILIALGGIFLADDMGILYVHNVWHIFWPAVILVVGFSLITRRNVHRDGDPGPDGKKNDIDYLDDFSMFGGREISVDSQNFRGGKITAMFGGSTIDLRNANLSPHSNVLDVFAMFGGTSIIVPPDWTVHVEVSALLGGFSDKRSSALKVVPDPHKVLIIKGFVMFGGGDVKLTK